MWFQLYQGTHSELPQEESEAALRLWLWLKIRSSTEGPAAEAPAFWTEVLRGCDLAICMWHLVVTGMSLLDRWAMWRNAGSFPAGLGQVPPQPVLVARMTDSLHPCVTDGRLDWFLWPASESNLTQVCRRARRHLTKGRVNNCQRNLSWRAQAEGFCAAEFSLMLTDWACLFFIQLSTPPVQVVWGLSAQFSAESKKWKPLRDLAENVCLIDEEALRKMKQILPKSHIQNSCRTRRHTQG